MTDDHAPEPSDNRDQKPKRDDNAKPGGAAKPKIPTDDKDRNQGLDPRVQSKIITGLRDHPEYLLLFGLAGLFFGALSSWLLTGNSTIMWFALAGLVVLVIASIVVVSLVRKPPPQPVPVVPQVPAAPSIGARSDIDVGDKGINTALTTLVSNVRTGLTIGNEVFKRTIRARCNELVALSVHWKQNVIRAKFPDYNLLLVELYASAKKTVFSTSAPEYLSTWTGPLGGHLLAAHGRSTARVTRVFVFKERVEVTDEMYTQFKLQQKLKIEVRLFFDDEVTPFDLPPEEKDFTIIDDGEAIGKTLTYSQQNIEAEWYFSSEEITPKFDGYRSKLIDFSIDLPTFEHYWSTRPGLGKT